MRRRPSLRILLALAASAALAPPARAAWPTDPTVNLAVCTAAGDQGPPLAAPDGAGGAFLAWLDGRAGGQIFAQRLSADGTPLWMDGGLPLAPPGATSDPLVAADGAGGVVIAWVEDSGSARALEAQRLDGAGNPLWPAGVTTLRARTDQTSDDAHYSIWLWDQLSAAGDGAGGLFLALRERHNENNPLDPSLYTSQLLLLHVDGGGVLLDERVLAEDQYICSFCGDGFFHMDDYSDLLLAPGAPAGVLASYRVRPIINHGVRFQPPEIHAQEPVLGWSALVATAAADVQHPRAATDSARGAVVSWQDTRSGSPRLYAARVTAPGGALVWTLGGVPVSGGAGEQYGQEMVAAPGGGATLVWLDLRNGGLPDVYAQRLDGLGGTLWPGDVALCTQPTTEGAPALAGTADGGSAFAWRDLRSGTGDVYGRFVSAAGSLFGSPDGDPICDAAGDQSSPALVASGTQAIAAWMDRRSGTSADIFAQRIGWAGPVSGVVDGGAGSRIALAAFPNPSDGPVSVRFNLPHAGRASLRIVDLAGRLVAAPQEGAMAAGPHEARWDGRDARGRLAASGVYLAVLEADGRRLVRRLAVVR